LSQLRTTELYAMRTIEIPKWCWFSRRVCSAGSTSKAIYRQHVWIWQTHTSSSTNLTRYFVQQSRWEVLSLINESNKHIQMQL